MNIVLTATLLGLAMMAGCLGSPADPSPPSKPEGAAGGSPQAGGDGAGSGSGLPLGAAEAQPAWASPGAARIHPGIQTFTDGAQCTANFVWHAPDGAGGFDLYIGQAAHCAATGAATETDGCRAKALPLGTKVDLGTGNDGVLAYSSWTAMQEAGETDPAACASNDFALVRIAEADEAHVSPQVPFFGGPTGLAPTEDLDAGDEAYSFGNSGLRLGVEPALSWKHGTVVASGAWSAKVYTATPGVPGDSGSGFLAADGRAFGVLSTLEFLPVAGSNNVSSLASALEYAAAHGGPDVTLGTAPFTGGLA
jgi:hypothetical protein